MKPVVLSLDCPKLRLAMSDMRAQQHWEMLRRSSKPLTVHELAEACGTSDSVAQSMLDLLVDARIAVRMRATATRRKITYAVVSSRVIVEWDKKSESHFAFLLEMRRMIRAYSRSAIDRNDDLEMRAYPDRQKFRGHQSFMLTRSEAAEVMQALRTAWELITQVEARAQTRASKARPASPSAATAPSAAPPAGGEEEHPYHIAIEFRPLRSPELPLADLGVWEKGTIARELEYLTKLPSNLLTDREREIAQRLAAGGTRPEVAAALGVAPSTIASATKRIYAKLGVRSRAEFVSRMKNG